MNRVAILTASGGFVAILWAVSYYVLFVHTPQAWTAHCPPTPTAWDHNPTVLRDAGGCRFVSGEIVRANDVGSSLVRAYVLSVDPYYSDLLNQKNRDMGGLLLEVEPAHQRPPYSLMAPRVGQHVCAVGSYVLDTDHGHMEIHPTTWMETC